MNVRLRMRGHGKPTEREREMPIGRSKKDTDGVVRATA